MLSDADKRQTYDRFGHSGLHGAGMNPGFNNSEEIFSHFSDLFGDLFGFGGGGRGGAGGRRARRGGDLTVRVDVDFLDAVHGSEQEITVGRDAPCEVCDGSGIEPGHSPETCETCGGVGEVIQAQMFLRIRTVCPTCHGSGQIIRHLQERDGRGTKKVKNTLKVTIPAGIESGQVLRLGGKGNSVQGATAICTSRWRPTTQFFDVAPDIFCEVPVSYAQACLGAEIVVPTVHGESDLTIPRGTPSGKVFR